MPGISPADLDGLVLWLDADAIAGLSDGDTVVTWADQSGEGNDMTNVGPNAAITYETNVLNGLPVVKMEVGGFTGGPTIARPYSIFYVANFTAGDTNFHRAIQGATTNWLLGPWQGQWTWFAGGFAGGAPTAGTDWVIHGCNAPQTGLGGTHHVEDVDAISTLASGTLGDGLSAPGAICLGNAGALNEPMGGQIAEIVVYDRALTPGERDDLVAYFRDKWGAVAISDGEGRLAREAAVVAASNDAEDSEARLAREAALVAHHYPEELTHALLESVRVVVAISRPHGWG
jgi:hypothetical protein